MYQKALYILWLLIGVSCTNRYERTYLPLLDQAELLIDSDPETAYALLDSIEYPEFISAKQNARWAMMRGKLADSLQLKWPYLPQMERAERYIERHGSIEEQVQIGFYIGKTLVAEKLSGSALNYYLKALNKSLEINNYQLAGYACSYMGDVYEFQATYDLSREKYEEAAHYFSLAANRRSQGIAYRDVARSYAFADSLDKALTYMYKADTLLRPVGDSLDMATVYNGYGNIYLMQGDYKLAEKYLYKSISLNKKDVAPDYEALAHLYLLQGDLEQAEYCLKQAEAPTTNIDTHTEILYFYSMLEKQRGNLDSAYTYLQQYVDSTEADIMAMNQSNIIEVGKRYQHVQVIQENVHLRKAKSRITYVLIGMIIIALSSAALFLYRLNRKNRHIYAQQLDLERMNNNLLQLQNELLTKHNKLEMLSAQLKELEQSQTMSQGYMVKKEEAEQLGLQIRELRLQMLQTSPITLRVHKLAEHVTPNAKKSPLTAKDWKAIYELIHTIAPELSARIEEENLGSGEKNLYYLSFFDLKTSGEAILLNLANDSVYRYRQKLRNAFQLKDKQLTFSAYLLSQL